MSDVESEVQFTLVQSGARDSQQPTTSAADDRSLGIDQLHRDQLDPHAHDSGDDSDNDSIYEESLDRASPIPADHHYRQDEQHIPNNRNVNSSSDPTVMHTPEHRYPVSADHTYPGDHYTRHIPRAREHFPHSDDFSPAASYNGPPMKPETFDGETDWEAFYAHFKVCADLGRWDTRSTALALVACMRGHAQVFVLNLPEAERNTYKLLSQRLCSRFGSERNETRWLTLFESRFRGSDESIAAFADDITRLARRAYPKLDSLAQETVAVNQLNRSLSNQMRFHCRSTSCSTIETIVNLVQTYEGIVGNGSDKKKSNIRMISSDKPTYNKGDRSHLPNNQGWQIKQNWGRQDKQNVVEVNEQNPRTCYICGSTKHLKRYCPHNAYNRDNRCQGNAYNQDNRYQGNAYNQDSRYQGNAYNRDNQDSRYQGNAYNRDNRYQGNAYNLDNRYQGNAYNLDNRYQGNAYNQGNGYYQGTQYAANDASQQGGADQRPAEPKSSGNDQPSTS